MALTKSHLSIHPGLSGRRSPRGPAGVVPSAHPTPLITHLDVDKGPRKTFFIRVHPSIWPARGVVVVALAAAVVVVAAVVVGVIIVVVGAAASAASVYPGRRDGFGGCFIGTAGASTGAAGASGVTGRVSDWVACVIGRTRSAAIARVGAASVVVAYPGFGGGSSGCWIGVVEATGTVLD